MSWDFSDRFYAIAIVVLFALWVLALLICIGGAVINA